MFENLVKKKYLIWAGVFLIWAGVIVATLWNNGYQQPQSRHKVTDEELIKIAVYRAIRTMEATSPHILGSLDKTDNYRPNTIIPYRDVKHFLEENPECCIISKPKWDFSIYIDVFGKVFFKDSSGQVHSSQPIELLSRQSFPDCLYYMP